MNLDLNKRNQRTALVYPVLISSLTGAACMIGIGVWRFILNHRESFPLAGTSQSKDFLRSYLNISHNIFLILLTLAIIILIILITKNRSNTSGARLTQSTPIDQVVRFTREQPLATVFFIAYTVAMVQGTTWLYPELVGWYSDVIGDHLLNNFSINQGLVKETMRRSDFRFFPLAHQDLHILSWLTAYVKVWMLASAAELIAIVVLATRFVRRLSGEHNKHGNALLLITALLLMLHPSTASGFFQLIYCERLLTLIFVLFISAYLHYQHTHSRASFYSTCLFGLTGIFIKDTAVILFVGPPLTVLIAGSMGWVKGPKGLQLNKNKRWIESYRLELWLLTLIPIFLCSYIFLTLIPSSYNDAGAYDKGTTLNIDTDWRFWFLALMIIYRLSMSSMGRIRLNFLDALNISGLSYAGALLCLVGLHSSSYLTLPIQLITVLNLTWIWNSGLSPKLNHYLPWRRTATLGTAIASAIVIFESKVLQPSFLSTFHSTRHQQASSLKTYQHVEELAQKTKQIGNDVNIIYSDKSWYSRKRHLDRIKYDRLIEYDSQAETFRIKDGINKDSIYDPKPGDIIINIDHAVSDLNPILLHRSHIQLYRHNGSDSSGAVFRLQ